MRVTHYGHACVLVETASARLLFDPGTLSTGFEGLRDLTALLVTHHHDDHLDLARIDALMTANPAAVLLADRESAPLLAHLGVREVAAGERIDLGVVAIEALGGAHAFVYRDFPACANLSYLVDGGAFFHPGDSFVVPETAVDVLGLPTSGPWLKIGEVIDYLRAVAPRVAVPIHEAALANTTVPYFMLREFCPPDTAVTVIHRGVPTEV